jgi:hypothetical protein
MEPSILAQKGSATERFYGMGPTVIGEPGTLDFSTHWHEFMDLLYMPVVIPGTDPDFSSPVRFEGQPLLGPDGRKMQDGSASAMSVPPSLAFLRPVIDTVMADACSIAPHLAHPYVYVSARRGYASPGNPLNRPGWHTDDFGGTDLNYIWTDRFPTVFLLSDEPIEISNDEQRSMRDMHYAAAMATMILGGERRVVAGQTNTLYRLTPHVIHAAPQIPAPGGMRSFFKISVSDKRYDLLGNAHNHGLDYDWPMRAREATRNPTSQMHEGRR